MLKASGIKIAIASGKGGTGKTLIATNLFQSLSMEGIPVTLVDCDAEAPNAKLFFKSKKESIRKVTRKVPVIDENHCTYCGKCHEYCNYHAIFFLPQPQMIKVIEELCHGCGACLVACKYGAILEKDSELGTITRYSLTNHNTLIESRMHTGVYSPVQVIKEGIKEATDQMITILDAPPGTSCPFIHTVLKAGYVVLVTEPTPFGLSNLKQTVDTLRLMEKSFGVIINRAGLGNDDVYNYIKQENIKLLLEIPFQREIASTYSRGTLLTEIEPEWEKKFLSLFDTILKENGNINHQR
jgi:MinD superfamily P-loop ATPase